MQLLWSCAGVPCGRVPGSCVDMCHCPMLMCAGVLCGRVIGSSNKIRTTGIDLSDMNIFAQSSEARNPGKVLADWSILQPLSPRGLTSFPVSSYSLPLRVPHCLFVEHNPAELGPIRRTCLILITSRQQSHSEGFGVRTWISGPEGTRLNSV